MLGRRLFERAIARFAPSPCLYRGHSMSTKRKNADAPISPPPLKRVVKSGTTSTDKLTRIILHHSLTVSESAVASFFTPASQKPKTGTIQWTERAASDDEAATLLVGRYEPADQDNPPREKRRKMAAFDLDSTLIRTSSGKKHASSAADWQWWDSRVPDRLRELRTQGYQIIILSNQGGLTLHPDAKTPKAPKTPNAQKRLGDFKQKCSAVLASLDLPTTIYAATGRDRFRKPRTGMWEEAVYDYDDVIVGESFFVGDAGGRTGKAGSRDFSCSDRNFAHNVGLRYLTPEEFFLSEEARDFQRDFDLAQFPYAAHAADAGPAVMEWRDESEREIVLLCGPPGAGKSTFYWTVMQPLGYERVNQDRLKTRDRCLQTAEKLVGQGRSVVVDNTNADIETRASWISLANRAKVPIRCVWLSTPMAVCEHNDAVRALNTSLNPEGRQGLPKVAFTGFASRFRPPRADEGFQEVTEVQFSFRGTEEEYAIWGRYWT